MKICNIEIHNFRSTLNEKFFLKDYSLLVGANNSGKSNIIDAIRIFYEKEIKYEVSRDFPKFKTRDKDVWIDIEFVLTDEEYQSLKEDYRQPNNKLKVRKYIVTKEKGSDGKLKNGIYGYIGSNISDEHFYGSKNIQQGKFGKVIYIPAASKLDEHTKLTGPSSLRDLINEVINKITKSSISFKDLRVNFEKFASTFKQEKTEDDKSLNTLEKEISKKIEDWGATFELKINPITESELLKNLLTYKVKDIGLNQELDASQFGQGFQRHLIFSLIILASEYKSVKESSKQRDFTPDLTLILFEEPEAFLHPPQKIILTATLRDIASDSYYQVLVATHSEAFVSQNTFDIPSIIHLSKKENKTIIGQINSNKLNELFVENQELNNLLASSGKEIHCDDMKDDMEAVKYFLWLNPERCGTFFSDFVILVEGPTERILLNYFIQKHLIKAPFGGLFILECIGKYNIHRFMNLLGYLKIYHSILFDKDEDKDEHKIIRKHIEEKRNQYTNKIDWFEKDIESFLNIERPKKKHRKPQNLMLKYKENLIDINRINALIEKIKKLY